MQAPSSSNPPATSAMDNAIKVLVRIRPPDTSSSAFMPPPTPRKGAAAKDNAFDVEGNTIAEPKAGLHFTFDHVANQDASQSEIFDIVGESSVDCYLEGYNATVFAYGQTGAGKTFTMQGPGDECNWESEQRGLIPRTLKNLFHRLDRLKAEFGEKVQYSLSCTLLEIYNEQVYDLMVPLSNRCLTVRERKDNSVYVEGLLHVPISSPEEAYEELMKGWTNRRVASTNMNRESSRSHSLFTLYLETKTVKDEGVVRTTTSKLNLIDLAGSERQKDTNAVGERVKEAGSINKSLSAIGNVIQALVDNGQGKKRHIPYRDSTLSFLLRDSLGGNTKTYIVACVHPGNKTLGESISTLRFVSRAKLIKNHAVINEDVEGDKQALQAEIRHLKQSIAQLQASCGTSSSSSTNTTESRGRTNDWKKEFIEAMTLWQKQGDQVEDLKAQNRALHEDLQRKNKIKLQHKLMMKFREDRIKELEQLVKMGGGDDAQNLVKQKDDEILALSQRLESLSKNEEKQESATILELKNRIKAMKNDEHLKQRISANASLAQELESKVKSLMEETRGDFLISKAKSEDAAAAAAAAAEAAEEIETLKRQVTSWKDKLTEKTDELEACKLEFQTRAEKLEESLRQTQQNCEEVTNALKAAKLKTQIETENKNKEYLNTIKSMTPRSGRTPLRTRRMIPMRSLNASYLVTSPAMDDAPRCTTPAPAESGGGGIGLEEETLPTEEGEEEAAGEEVAAATEELRQITESQGTRIEELTRQIQTLDEAKSQLLDSNETFAREVEKLTEEATRQSEKIQAAEVSNCDLRSQSEKLSRDLKDKLEELRIARSEAEDYRLMEAQAGRRLTEVKTEYSTVIDGKEHQIEEFETKLAHIELSLQTVNEEKEEALKALSERDDNIVRLEDEVLLGQSSANRLESELEIARKTEKDLTSSSMQLRADLDKATERNTHLTQEISSRGDEMEGRLMAALHQKEEAEDCIRSFEDQLGTLRAERKQLEADSASTKEMLGQSKRRGDDLKAVLVQVQEHSSNLEDELKAKECQLNDLLNEREDLKKELLEKSASVERALREADNLDAQLEETKKAMATQKSSHEFHMESLSEDHKCLMDLVDEMKAEAATAQEDNRGLKQHLEALEVDLTTTVRQKKEAEKKAGERREWATSPNRLEELAQEKEALVSRQSDLLDKIAKYESGRQERERDISELKARAEKNEADSLLLRQIRAKYESLKTELDYARLQSESNASAVVAMTTRLDDADAERRRLEEERRNLMSDADEAKNEIRSKKESLEREVADLQRQRSIWAKEAEETSELKERYNSLLTVERAAEDQIVYWKKEYEKVQKENGYLMGHSNHKQKINHIVDLKNQLTAQKQENSKLKMDYELLRKKFEASKLKENRLPPFR